jgi:hypothetical protein
MLERQVRHVDERRRRRWLGSLLNLASPGWHLARLAVLFAGKHSGEERTDRRTENRPSLPRGHHSTTTIVSTIERQLRFRFNWAETTSGVRGLSAGRGNPIKRSCDSIAFTTSCRAFWVRTATSVRPPDRSCACKCRFSGSESTGLLDLASSGRPSTDTGCEKALACAPFQCATNQGWFPPSCEPMRARLLMEDELR